MFIQDDLPNPHEPNGPWVFSGLVGGGVKASTWRGGGGGRWCGMWTEGGLVVVVGGRE